MPSNTAVVKGIYDSLAQGDLGAVLDLLDPHIDWREPEAMPFDDQTSRDGVAENIFGRVLQLVRNFSVTPDELHEAGDVVFGIGSYRGTAVPTGRDFEAAFVHVWRMKDGRIAGFRTYTDTHIWRQALGHG